MTTQTQITITERPLRHFYWQITYYPRCLILLAKHRHLPSNMSLAATLAGIARFQVRPHWLRG